MNQVTFDRFFGCLIIILDELIDSAINRFRYHQIIHHFSKVNVQRIASDLIAIGISFIGRVIKSAPSEMLQMQLNGLTTVNSKLLSVIDKKSWWFI